MAPAAVSILLTAAFAFGAVCQETFGGPDGQITIGRRTPQHQTPASPGWPFGRPHTSVRLEGLLLRSDGETLSLELADERIVRFQLDRKTLYVLNGKQESLNSFHMTDFVEVDGEVTGSGVLSAHSLHFVRSARREEQARAFQSPELLQRWRCNLLGGGNVDPAADDRRLDLVSKPDTIVSEPLISLVRRFVNEAFERLPNFRAREITSMFQSFSRPVKWVPDGVVSAEIAYEEERESYSDIHADGTEPVNAPETADADYMRSLNKAWSTGDFETISHCVFSELADSDFRRAGTEERKGEQIVTYEFSGRRPSDCIGINFKSQVIYPAYKGSIKVRAQTGDVLHVALEATEIPTAFPLDRAERSVDFETVRIGERDYLLPKTAYWFGCFRNTYSCFLNRIDFQDYRRFRADSTVLFSR